MGGELVRPWGRVKAFEFKLNDRKNDDDSPSEAWISINLWMEAEDAPPFTVSLWLPETKDAKEADELYNVGKQIESLLDDHVKAITLDTFVK